MSRTDRGPGTPRAVVHRRILDVAASRPDASLEAIADDVAGATADLVERVLDEYGDPAATDTETDATEPMKANGNQSTEDATAAATDPSSLSAKQRETLRFVHEHPEWSQADIAESLGVSRATVSRRLNDIPGFEWYDRASFAAEIFPDDPGSEGGANPEGSGEAPGSDETGEHDGTGDGPATDPEEPGGGAPDASEEAAGGGSVDGSDPSLDRFDERLARIETRLEGQGVGLPPDLAHKVIHACMESDRITEEEELRLIEALLDR